MSGLISIQSYRFDVLGGLIGRPDGGPTAKLIQRRVAQSAVLDDPTGSGVVVHDGGLYRAESPLAITIASPSREQLAAADRLMTHGEVTVAVWHGGYLCVPESMSYQPGSPARLLMTFIPKRVLTDA